MWINQHIIAVFILFSFVLTGPACKKLDEDGGYYDEKTRTYKYVNITKKGVKKSSVQVFSPTPGKPQHIPGVVTKIGENTKSIWIKIKDRQPYMILAERLSGSNRNDKDKELKITLKYVSPLGSVTRRGSFRKKWIAYTTKMLTQQLMNKTVLVEIEYEERARKLNGTVYTVISTDKGDRTRNINLWMVLQGLSYYFIDHGKSPDDKQFINAQKLAQKAKSGLWKYQR